LNRLRLVLVDTEGSINLGMILRLAANFSVKEIYIVSTRQYDQEEVKKYAVRADYLYDSLIRVSSIDDALAGCDIKVCTTAKSSEEDVLRSTVSSAKLPELLSGYGSVCLVFGRESTGLTREELSKCDIASTIPTSSEYPSLNLTNAVAIYLYELLSKNGELARELKVAQRDELEGAIAVFSQIAAEVMRDTNKITRAERAFRKMIYASSTTRTEVRIITHVLRRALRRIKLSKGIL